MATIVITIITIFLSNADQNHIRHSLTALVRSLILGWNMFV